MTDSKSEPKFSKVIFPTNGLPLWLPISDTCQSNINSAAKYQAKPSDIFVCAYPKCGTTWMQKIVWLIVHGGQSFEGNMRKSIPMLEFDGHEAAEAIDDSIYPRIIKTHLPYSMTPKNPKAKYVYITRNPKDALVSYYYHVKGFANSYECPNVTMNDIYQKFVEGKMEFNSYFDHVIQWYSKRDQNNVLFLLYEDLKLDLKSNITRIARFLGSGYEDDLLSNKGEVLQKVLEQCSFKYMKKQPKNTWVNIIFN